MSRLATLALAIALVAAVPLTVLGQQSPDVIVGDLHDLDNYGAVGGIYAFAVGTTSCNIGNLALTWDVMTNLHPVIAQNMYRLKDGRFEQIGMSWLKHGFYALSGSLCNSCSAVSDGTALNVGCSDPYDASLNGSQGNGPRSEVNAATGYFPFPYGFFPAPAATIGRRLQVAAADLDPAQNAGAQYFVEGHYVHPEDAQAGNKNNNASYRKVNINPNNWNVSLTASTQRMKPGIQAWQDTDPTVQIHAIDVPGDGRIFVAFNGKPGPNGLYHYEYAVQNLNSDRSVGSFTVELWPGAQVSNIGFHAVPSHSGEPFSNTTWTTSQIPGTLFPGSLTWSTTSHNVNPNANALRWGSLYNFSFDCDQLPGNASLGLFKPGTPTSMPVPSFCPPKRPPPPPPAPYTLVTSTPYDFVDIGPGANAGLPGPVGDDNAFAVPIGFSFPFYGQPYTQVVMSTNGYLTFVGQDGTLYTNTTLPSAANPLGIIAGYWDDLNCPNLLNTRYKTVNGRFVAYWDCVHNGDLQPLRFEIILEPNGTIVSTIVACPAAFAGNGATRGIESWTGTEGLLLSFNSPNSALNTSTVRYEVNSGVPASSNMFFSGSLAGGFFKVAYVSSPGSIILIMTSLNPGPTDFGALGVLKTDFFTAIGVWDYIGFMTGFPNPAAITGGPCSSSEFQFWAVPGSVPSGVTFYTAGLDFPTNPLEAVNNWFHLSNDIKPTVP